VIDQPKHRAHIML